MYCGIPYMGSKRKLAPELIDFMIRENPNAKYFYDLFGGGGAMSFQTLNHPQIERVFYNELNTGVVELLKDVLRNGVTSKYYEFVNRETFDKNKNKNNWFGGMCKTIYSFGNNQKEYIYGKKIEKHKELCHNVIVKKCEKSLLKINETLEINFSIDIPNTLFLMSETINQRRLRFCKSIKGRFGAEHLERLQHLERLAHLEKLKHLKYLEKLKISNLSYEKVNIKTPVSETIIYLDPPYFKKGKYQNDINHDDLYNYIKKSKYKIYLSSYESELKCVFKKKHRCTLSATSNNEVTEKLFVNT